MKLLVTTCPAFGHLLPMLPLTRAAKQAGDVVIVSTAEQMAEVAPDLAFTSSGPSIEAMIGEQVTRSGVDVTGPDGPDTFRAQVELFTRTRVDMAFDSVLAVVRDENPDLILAEEWDYVAPLVASATGTPWATFNHSPRSLADTVLESSAQENFDRYSLKPMSPSATVQLWPEWLQGYGFLPAAAEIAIQPSAHRDPTSSSVVLPAESSRPRVLVTMGTAINDIPLFNAAVAAVVDAGADVVVALSVLMRPDDLDVDLDHVIILPFTPLGEILSAGVQAVVTVGGSGTTLAALTHGVPLVFLPQAFNQAIVADLVEREAAGVLCRHHSEVGAAITSVLTRNSYRAAALTAQQQLQNLPTPGETWNTIKSG